MQKFCSICRITVSALTRMWSAPAIDYANVSSRFAVWSPRSTSGNARLAVRRQNCSWS